MENKENMTLTKEVKPTKNLKAHPKSNKKRFKKVFTPTNKPTVIWTYMLSGLIIDSNKPTKEVLEVLENAKEELKNLNLKRTGFLTWKGYSASKDQKSVVKTQVKAWKIANILWAFETTQSIFDGKTGKNVKRYTSGGGSLVYNIIFAEEVLGKSNLLEILKDWSYGRDTLAVGRTKFEIQAQFEPDFLDRVLGEFGVISSEKDRFLTKDEYRKREERLKDSPSRTITQATSHKTDPDSLKRRERKLKELGLKEEEII